MMLSGAPGERIEWKRPDWATDEYIRQCAADAELQANWLAQRWDWYLCGETDEVRIITDLNGYFRTVCKYDLRLDDGAKADKWGDVYLPEPPDIRAERQRRLVEAGFSPYVLQAKRDDQNRGPVTVEQMKARQMKALTICPSAKGGWL